MLNIVLPERALYEPITCFARRNEANRLHEQKHIAIYQAQILCMELCGNALK